MREIITDIEQNTPEWLALRCGSIGGSGITNVVCNGKGREDYMDKKVAEILTGVPIVGYQFRDAERGHIYEPLAITTWELRSGIEAHHAAMIKDGPYKHYSPDGLVGDDGLLESKVRLPHVYVKKFRTQAKPETSERRQIQWGLYMWEREWCDYIQLCPEMPTNKMIVQRIYRDEKEIKELSDGADKFIDEMLSIVERIKA